MISISGGDVEVTTLLLEDSALLVRMFNAGSNINVRKISFDAVVDKVEAVQLNGEQISSLQVYPESSGRSYVQLAIPRFGIQTLKVHVRK